MTKITSLIKNAFDSRVRQRGNQYYYDEAVTLIEATHDHVYAEVQGSAVYDVEILLIKNRLSISCTCPFFHDYGACKHIWATLLAAETNGTFQSLDSKKLRLVTGFPKTIKRTRGLNEYDGDEDDEFDGDEFSEGYDDLKTDEFKDILPRDNSYDFKPVGPAAVGGLPGNSMHSRRKQSAHQWEEMLKSAAALQEAYKPDDRFAHKDIIYTLNYTRTLNENRIVIETFASPKNADGTASNVRPFALTPKDVETITDERDRNALLSLYGAAVFSESFSGYYWRSSSTFMTPFSCQTIIIPRLCATGRFFLQGEHDILYGPYHVDAAGPWELRLEIGASADGSKYLLKGALWRDGVCRGLQEPRMVTSGGYAFWPDCTVSPLDEKGCFPLLAHLRKENSSPVEKKHAKQFIADYLTLREIAPLSLPEELHYEEIKCLPSVLLKIMKPKEAYNQKSLYAKLFFIYDGKELPFAVKTKRCYEQESNRLIIRDCITESAAVTKLEGFGFKRILPWSGDYNADAEMFAFPAKIFDKVAGALLADQWKVEAEGSLYRKAGDFSVSIVSSGIDWFDLEAECDFNGIKASLPQLLEALKKGEPFVRLGDGSLGMLPQQWLERYAPFARMGEEKDNCIRFRKSQALIIDMLLQDETDICCDEVFERVRTELKTFSGIQPLDPHVSFTGTLRPYQREGLGWLHFLQRFGFGGCLADDMGLGKTIQVLALFAVRSGKGGNGGHGTSLIIVPRSLIFNWMQEAQRFTPDLRVLDFSHGRRSDGIAGFDDYDLVLITYGTLRRDIETLREFFFDYVVLDEAQAIKNASTATAKAVRLLKANHRLALSGTPVENHLGELWSIFEFLNPGMLGSATAFKDAETAVLVPGSETCGLLRTALRPFILRRTKAQVAPDLPAKLEETLYCEMKPPQKKLYNELRDHYRSALLGHIEKEGINKIKIQILEALLRLRQAACHPGLIDKKRRAEPSAKLETLIAQLSEVVEEGHKALVFSQFTSMLSIVCERIDTLGFTYEYLDGKVRDRRARVERFQNDPDCKLFFISLKAGGLGLNLTSAEYVFLLDPWWNPAVEAQAIDRTHRIGQSRPVFAYRLICKDTVEEKVLLLQKNKRALADSIITADNSMIRSMRPEDLTLLLS